MLSSSFAEPGTLPPAMDELLDMHCFDCHDDATTKGDLDLMALDPAATDAASLAMWTRVLDRVESGEMPPEKKERPDPKLVSNAMGELAEGLRKREEDRYGEQGRVVARRMNRLEYEHTLQDLLKLPGLEVKEMLPADPEASGFDNVSQAQRLSYVQLGRYLDAARKSLKEAAWLAPEIDKFSFRMPFRDMQRFKSTNDKAIVGTEVVALRQPNTAQTPWRMNGIEIPFPGTYVLKFRGRAATYFKALGKMPEQGELLPPESPQTVVVYQGTRPLGSFQWGEKAEVREITARLAPREELFLYFPDMQDWNPGWRDGKSEYRGPSVALDWVGIEGPEEAGKTPESYRAVFGDLPVVQWKEGMPGPQPEKIGQLKNRNKFPQLKLPAENQSYFVKSDTPEKDARRLLEDFMERAFRRPVPAGEADRYFSLIKADLDKGKLFEDALITGLSGVLCSPDFLFFTEKPGKLDDHALANRLSYFLWRSMPDETLRKLADEGKLSDPAELRKQTERMLDDTKSRRFVEDFTDQWLSLREIRATQPDGQLYPEYDDFLLESMLEESRLSFREMLTQNLPARDVVDADFMFVNSALADLYGIPGIEGAELRKIKVPEGSPRGGFLTQAAVLKVTANGTNTSPVVRGVWVLDHILGEHPSPPPPDVPAIEPDTRGANTVRQLLDKHRADPSCASCHVVIDPPGFALENFDVIGGWREKYRHLGNGKKVEVFVDTKLVRYRYGLPVDSTGRMKDGREFDGIREFKKVILEDEPKISRNLANRLTVFATGAGITFSDRSAIGAILDETESSNHGLRDLIHAIVQSELFLNK